MNEGPCLPCLKKIINENAATTVACLKSVSEEIPDRVAGERLAAADANAFLSAVIELEKDFCNRAAKLMDEVNAKTSNPY